MNKEDIINILNQHGIDVLYDVIDSEINKAYIDGLEQGEHIGWCECYDMLEGDE